ncbi:ATP-binding cassette domain-containing protein [Shimwellia pseudoproteus]|uniref:methionine ABC transporter ATP-binding protein n=1 Tax=Shimwellia pseudoproteus TaxID=570012 RepID=UPI0018EB053E|nr:ATP-binding cassette domain-containing protein [Shimwellia pseudoproteus]MBJ3816137.1 ATP-binding cassette domain-containing protein [Shimwellia pseudoproteus]
MVSIPFDILTATPATLSGHSQRGEPHVQVSGLTKRYAGQQSDALHNIDLAIPRGTIFGIIGRSGAGKSSLIRCLNRLEAPTAGRIVIEGTDINTLTEPQLVAWRRSTGMIFQHFNLLSAKTVRQNIELPLKVAGVPPAERRQRTDALLDLVGLESHQHAWPAQLSGGQKQRVGIARALVHNPDLLLCDEATSALDPETTRAILDLLRTINRQRQITIVLITHEMDVIHDLCHQVAVLDSGHIVEQGPVWQVYGDPRQAITRQLLNPDRDSLPEALSSALAPERSSPQDRLLVRLRYHGAGCIPDIGQVSAAIPGGATLMRSDIEWVNQRPIGQLLLLLSPAVNATALHRFPSALADNIEVAGYVAGF